MLIQPLLSRKSIEIETIPTLTNNIAENIVRLKLNLTESKGWRESIRGGLEGANQRRAGGSQSVVGDEEESRYGDDWRHTQLASEI